MTERGPVNVPVLVTSFADFQRVFGQPLDPDDFRIGDRGHGFFPHAVEGFFTNGGRRMYVTRVLPEDAAFSERMLFDRGLSGGAETMLLRAAARDSGTTVHPPLLYVTDATGMATGNWVRIGDGSRAEYHQIQTVGSASHHAANTPLLRPHDAGRAIVSFPSAAATNGSAASSGW
jgi:hypothetical protein